MPDPFINALEELLEDQLESIGIEKTNPDYRLAENRKREIFQTLKSLPEIIETKTGAINIHDLLFELSDLTGCLEGAHFDAGIKRGFSLAFKLIIHNICQ
jgi:hypothetical protein